MTSTATLVREHFENGYGFPLDAFQRRAVDALVDGRSVLVAAPTGAGKTVVGEFACWAALELGTKCFYTTPIKALSNQKYRDLCARHGSENVGLLTGDRAVNGDAPVVVMTTEVLRNMLYEASPTLQGLRFVVLDEVHYLGDRDRGAVWEEVIIQLPAATQVAALSATVSNAEEFGEWLSERRDGCEVVIEESRPVPLRHHYFVNDRVYPTFAAPGRKGKEQARREAAAEARGGVPNPEITMLERRSQQRNRVTRKGRRVGGFKLRWPSRPRVVEELRDRRWLPAILFVFSRQGCEEAVDQVLNSGVALTSRAERSELGALADEVTADIPEEDLRVLGFARWRNALLHGVAAHHAGLVPAFKEGVELAFQRGLLKVVVATETLALGINMPARTVVIERLEKWNGEQHAMLSPGQYTQLTGRAGRRGIDRVGHAVVLYQRNLDFQTVAGLVGTRAYPLDSSFAPSYNMAVNLLRRHSRDQAETLLGASFAQFQADRSVSGLGGRLAELERGLQGYSRHLHCEVGDWQDYWSARRELDRREHEEQQARRTARSEAVNDALASLAPGDVVWVPWAPRRGLVAVAGVQLTKHGNVVAHVVTEDRAYKRMGSRELGAPPLPSGKVALPEGGNARQRAFRDEVASHLHHIEEPPATTQHETLRAVDGDAEPSAEVERLRARVQDHPCDACPDRGEHEHWQRQYDEVADEAAKLRERIQRRTGSLVRQFDRIIGVLTGLGYLEADDPTEHGLRLAGIYTEADLLVAECLRHGALDDLDGAELAGFAAHVLYEPRGGEPTAEPEIPTAALGHALDTVESLAAEIRGRERAAGLEPLGELDAGFVAPAWRWARGFDLDTSVGTLEVSGGDFVRTIKQVADLVGQLRDVADPPVRDAAQHALSELRRGIVAA